MKLLLLILCIVWGPLVVAYEFYAFVDAKCRATSGLVAHVSETKVIVWQLDGKFKKISRKNVKDVLVFSVTDNPFAPIPQTKIATSLLKKIFVGNNSKNSLFIGLPYKFVEELVFFHDTKGKLYVLDMGEIKRIEKVTKKELEGEKKSTHKSKVIDNIKLGDYLPHCLNKGGRGKASLRPNQVISGKIKVFEFFKNLEDGFNQIENFEERTILYGRPFLFEKRSRLGFNYVSRGREHEVPFPFYFQWSNGKEFHFQSQTVLGASSSKWLPNVEPLAMASSEVKSHFFNAIFIGNILSLQAGESALKSSAGGYGDMVRVAPHLNYLSMMGGDWRYLSLSAGIYFPSYVLVFGAKNFLEKREILARKSSPVFRGQIITDHLTVRMMYSYTAYDHSPAIYGKHFFGKGKVLDRVAEPIDNPEEYIYDARDIEEIKGLVFKSQFVRLGFDYQLRKDIQFGVDEVFMKGEYDESLVHVSDSRSITNQLEFEHLYTTAYIKQSFGHYVSLKLVGNIYIYKYDYSIDKKRTKVDDTSFSFGGSFELLF